jgi:DNA-directed RNA polymerase subunit RPC12/RpoP
VSDERIECVTCGRAFIWSAGEQRFYRERRLDRPKRCPDCRSQRRDESRSGMRGLMGPQWRPPAASRPNIFARIRAFLRSIFG